MGHCCGLCQHKRILPIQERNYNGEKGIRFLPGNPKLCNPTHGNNRIRRREKYVEVMKTMLQDQFLIQWEGKFIVQHADGGLMAEHKNM